MRINMVCSQNEIKYMILTKYQTIYYFCQQLIHHWTANEIQYLARTIKLPDDGLKIET